MDRDWRTGRHMMHKDVDAMRSCRTAAKAVRVLEVRREKQILFAAVITAVMLMLAVWCGMRLTEHAAAADNLTPGRTKCFHSILIHEGGTLWSIAQREMTSEWRDSASYIDEVRLINQLDGDSIMAGAYLVVPFYTGT